MRNNYKDVRECRNLIDSFKNKQVKQNSIYLKEEIEMDDEKGVDEKDAIPYTMKDELMSSILETAKQQFGADFSKIKQPMLYYPEDGDITLSGEISDLNDAKFQFRYKDSSGHGCYLWMNPIQLTDETIKKMSVVNGVFKNWQKSLSTAEDVKPMGYKEEEKDDNDDGVDENNSNLEPGDDID